MVFYSLYFSDLRDSRERKQGVVNPRKLGITIVCKGQMPLKPWDMFYFLKFLSLS